MITNMLIVTVLMLSNLLIFIALIFILIKARRRRQDSSFRVSPLKGNLEATEIMPRFSKSDSEQTVVMNSQPLSGRQQNADPASREKSTADTAKIPQETSVR